MSKWDNKSNNEILLEIKQMEYEHQAVKARMLKDYDELERIENEFNEANSILHKRLSGNID